MSQLHSNYTKLNCSEKLSEKCDYGEYLEHTLRDWLMCGLVSERIQQTFLSEVDLLLKKAFKTETTHVHRETYEMRASGSQMEPKPDR